MNKKLILYLGINLILISLLTLLSYFIGLKLRLFAQVYMFFPLIATMIIVKIFNIELSELGLELDFSNWLFIAWLLPFIIAHFSLGINLLFPGVELIDKFKGIMGYEILKIELVSLLAGATINLGFAFGEEIGWRGLLYKELREKGFWSCSLWTGMLWGLWHVPLILSGHNYPQQPKIGAVLFIFVCILMSPIYTLIRDKSNSVIAAALFHGSYNAIAGISIVAVKGAGNLLVGVNGFSGVITFGLLNCLIYIYLKRDEYLFCKE